MLSRRIACSVLLLGTVGHFPWTGVEGKLPTAFVMASPEKSHCATDSAAIALPSPQSAMQPTLVETFAPILAVQQDPCSRSLDAVGRELLIAALRQIDQINEPYGKACGTLYVAKTFSNLKIASAESLLDEARKATQRVTNEKQRIPLLIELVEEYRIKQIDAPIRPVEVELMQEALELSLSLEPSVELNQSLEEMAAWFTQREDETRARKAIAHLSPDYPAPEFLEHQVNVAVVGQLVREGEYEAAVEQIQASQPDQDSDSYSKEQALQKALEIRLDFIGVQILAKPVEESITSEFEEIQRILKQAKTQENREVLIVGAVSSLYMANRFSEAEQLSPELKQAFDQAAEQPQSEASATDERSETDEDDEPDFEEEADEDDRDFELYKMAEAAVKQGKHQEARSLLAQTSNPYSRLENDADVAASQSTAGASQEAIATLIQSLEFFQADPILRDDVEPWRYTFVSSFMGNGGRFQEMQTALNVVENEQYRQQLMEQALDDLASKLHFQDDIPATELNGLLQRLQLLPASEERSTALVLLAASFVKVQQWNLGLDLAETLPEVERVRSLLKIVEAHDHNRAYGVEALPAEKIAELIDRLRGF